MEEENNISYFRGKSETKVDVDFIKNELAQFLQLDNLNFLLGAGCSSHIENDEELGIPGMANLYKGFFEEHKGFKIAGSDVESIFDGNLEKMLGTMGAISVAERVKEIDDDIEGKICTVQKYIRSKIISGLHGMEVLSFYRKFYIKTVTQGRKNPINIFTTIMIYIMNKLWILYPSHITMDLLVLTKGHLIQRVISMRMWRI